MIQAFDVLLQIPVTADIAAKNRIDEPFRYECLCCGEEVFSAEVELSGGFDRWVLRQTDKIEVLAPPSVRNRINQLLQNIIASYRE